MASTSGWIRFSSRWKRVPTTFVTRLLSIRLLTIQPVGGDVAAHRVGHDIAYRASQSRPLPHERRRHVDRRYFDDPAVAPRAGCWKGWCGAGRKRIVPPNAAAPASAATRCPMCTGSNEPPNRASTRQDGDAALVSAGQRSLSPDAVG